MAHYKFDDTAEKLTLVFARLHRKIEKIHCSLLEDSNLKRAHVKILANICRDGKKNMTEIGDILMVPKSNVTPLIDELIEMKFICRKLDESDRRIIYINLTGQGKIFIDKYRSRFYSILRDKLKNLNSADYAKIEYAIELLDKIF
jgi:DNA-binding MarR family transcriptional regulator